MVTNRSSIWPLSIIICSYRLSDIEATQATEPATLCALVKGSQHVILLGDHFQLPPTVSSERAQQGTFIEQ